MRLQRTSSWLILLALVLSISGCSLEEGLRQGLTDGVSGAISALIETPVSVVLDQIFPT